MGWVPAAAAGSRSRAREREEGRQGPPLDLKRQEEDVERVIRKFQAESEGVGEPAFVAFQFLHASPAQRKIKTKTQRREERSAGADAPLGP